MARLGRIGRVLKWAGLVVSLLIVAIWAASIPWGLWGEWYNGGRYPIVALVGIQAGRLILEGGSAFAEVEEPTSHFDVRQVSQPTVNWRFHGVVHADGLRFDIELPLWIPFLFVAIPTAYLFWRDRRRIPPGHCQTCGYNLTGNVSGVCPECGQTI
jgi:hypothetical protein